MLVSLFEQLPSVHAVAGAAAPIGADALAGSSRSRTLKASGREDRLLVGVFGGTPNLLSTLGVAIVAGRPLNQTDDTSTSPTPVVITRSLAERFWTLGGSLGQTISLPELRGGDYLVVGVSENFGFGTLLRPVAGVITTARGDADFIQSNFVLQTDDAAHVVAAVPQLLANRVVRVKTGRDIVGQDIAQQRLGAWAFSGFGLIAFLLGIGGVFGLVTYFAQSRRRELGVRMALGATLADVLTNAVLSAIGPVAVGVLAGLLIGALCSRVFAALLVGIGDLDFSTYAGVGLVTMVPAGLASLAAAWRLRLLTPSEALRAK